MPFGIDSDHTARCEYQVIDVPSGEFDVVYETPNVTALRCPFQFISGVVLTPRTSELPDRARVRQKHQENHARNRCGYYPVDKPDEIAIQEERHEETEEQEANAEDRDPQSVCPEECATALAETPPREGNARHETHAMSPHQSWKVQWRIHESIHATIW